MNIPIKYVFRTQIYIYYICPMNTLLFCPRITYA